MTVNNNEILSALIDGELQGKELDQALHLLATDEQASAQLQRYQLATDVLHGHATSNQPVDLTAQISLALAGEPVFSSSATQRTAQVLSFPQQFWKQATGLAMVASIGALAVMSVMTQPQNQLVPITPLAVVEVPIATTVATATGNRWTVGEAEIAERLNTYLVDHNEYAGDSGVFSYARIVSYDTGQ